MRSVFGGFDKDLNGGVGHPGRHGRDFPPCFPVWYPPAAHDRPAATVLYAHATTYNSTTDHHTHAARTNKSARSQQRKKPAAPRSSNPYAASRPRHGRNPVVQPPSLHAIAPRRKMPMFMPCSCDAHASHVMLTPMPRKLDAGATSGSRHATSRHATRMQAAQHLWRSTCRHT